MNSEFYAAVKAGDLRNLEHLINGDETSLDTPTAKSENTALHVACKFGRLEAAELILRRRPEMAAARNVYGETALHAACVGGHLRVLEMLMELRPAAAAELDNGGRSPLYMACYYGNFEVVRYLVVEYKWVLGADEEEGGACLRVAASRGQADVVRELVEAHPSLITKTDENGNTSLHVAVSKRRLRIAEFLIEIARAKVNARNIKGDTALDIVARYGCHDVRSRALHDLLVEKQRIQNNMEKEDCQFMFSSSPNGEEDHSIDEILLEEHETRPKSPEKDETHQEELVNKNDLRRHRQKSERKRKQLAKLYIKQRYKVHESIYEEALQNARNTVVIVAVLIATVAFTAGVSPPGGVYQDGPYIGKSVLAKTSSAFKVFMISNSVALFVSLGVVIVLVSIVPFRRRPLMRILKYAHRAMWVAVSFMAAAFVAATWATIPDMGGDREVEWVGVVVLAVAVGCLGAVFIGWSVMVAAHSLRKSEWRRAKIDRGGEGVEAGGREDGEFSDDGGVKVNSDDGGVKVVRRRLKEFHVEGSDFSSINSDVASGSDRGYHPV